MLMFTRYVLLLTSLLSSVLAVPLASRDVVDPPITSPTANTVWHVGQTATVTWQTTGLPVNQTNPVGMLVLGYLYNNSENLMLNSPLATNLNYSVGQAQITVPKVPTRQDYIVVLFGDSGNASPPFTIINDASSSTSVAPSPATTTPADPTPPTASPSAASSPDSGATPENFNSGSSVGSSTHATASSAHSVTATTQGTQATSHTSTTSTIVVVTGSPSSTKSSAAWQKRVPSLGTPLSVVLSVTYFVFS